MLPDATVLLDYMLDLFTFIIRGLQVYPERMRENLEASYGLPFSQRVLLALIEKGMNRQEAYKIVQSNAMRAWEQRTPYIELLSEDPAIAAHLSSGELVALFDHDFYLRYVDVSFGRLGL